MVMPFLTRPFAFLDEPVECVLVRLAKRAYEFHPAALLCDSGPNTADEDFNILSILSGIEDFDLEVFVLPLEPLCLQLAESPL